MEVDNLCDLDGSYAIDEVCTLAGVRNSEWCNHMTAGMQQYNSSVL